MKLAPFLVLIFGLIIIVLYAGQRAKFAKFAPTTKRVEGHVKVPEKSNPHVVAAMPSDKDIPAAPALPIVALYPIGLYERPHSRRYLHGCQ